jgi:hypothetical protein
MGGNALKKVTTRRYEREEYFLLEEEVLAKVKAVLPHCAVEAIQAYHEKPSFGDMDIVIEKLDGVKEIIRSNLDNWGVEELFINGDAWSINYGDFQVDLIFMKPKYFRSTLDYFSYNDIGNLLGRVSRKVGFKLGHRGLNYVLLSKTSMLKDINVTNNYMEALEFIGYDSERFKKGFNTLEEMFEYVIDNPNFTPEIFALENRNHDARVRDAKRKNYRAFLNYIESKEYPKEVEADKNYELKRAFLAFPSFKDKYDLVFEKLRIKALVKEKFNGEILRAATGYMGTDLGLFYSYINKKLSNYEDLDSFFLEMSAASIDEFIIDTKKDLESKDIHYKSFYHVRIIKNQLFKELNIPLVSELREQLKKAFKFKTLMLKARDIGEPIATTDNYQVIFNINTYKAFLLDLFDIDYEFNDLTKFKPNNQFISKYEVPLDEEYIDNTLEAIANKEKYDNAKNAKKKSQAQNATNLEDILSGKNKGRLICIDIEQYEKNSDVITEVGYSLYDGGDISSFHYIIEENKSYRNGEHVPDNMDNYNFGISKYKSLEFVKDLILKEINKSDYLIGHAIRGDIRNLFGENSFCDLNVAIVDTVNLSKYILKGTRKSLSVGKLSAELKIDTVNLHNAGNDAYYNMTALVKSIEIYKSDFKE